MAEAYVRDIANDSRNSDNDSTFGAEIKDLKGIKRITYFWDQNM